MTSRLIVGTGLVLDGPELLVVARLVAHGAQALRQRDGVTLPAHVLDLVHHVEVAASFARPAISARGTRVAAKAPGNASSDLGIGADAPAERPGRLTTRQVAEALGLSGRYVTQIAGVLGGVKQGRDWSFDPEAVKAWSALRAEKE